MANSENKKQNRMLLVRRLHGLVENTDIEKHRQSQDQIGALLSNTKEISYKEIDVDGMDAEWVSVNRVHQKERVILYCHGGGYSTGSSMYARTLTSKLAMATSMDVLSFDYQLAPEHPYPAAAKDARKAWNYLMWKGYGAKDVIIAGDSAGGNLALSLTLTLKEENRFLPKGLVLMSPWTDLTSSGESYKTKAEMDPVLNKEYIERMIEAYAAEEDLTNPLISPLFGDLEGLPPTYIQTGENEILFSDSIRLYHALKEVGVSARMDVYPDMWHVFQMTPFKKANDAVNEIAEFINELYGN